MWGPRDATVAVRSMCWQTDVLVHVFRSLLQYDLLLLFMGMLELILSLCRYLLAVPSEIP